MASGKSKTLAERESTTPSRKQNTKPLSSTSKGQNGQEGTVESFLSALEKSELCPRILSVLVVTGLQDAMVEGVVFDPEGDYVDGQPLGPGHYVILGLGQIGTEYKPGVHVVALENSRATEPTP